MNNTNRTHASMSMAEYGLIFIAAVIVLLAALVIVGPLVKSIDRTFSEYHPVNFQNNPILDPYDSRWWGKRLTGAQYRELENALNGYMADTEFDGKTDDRLDQALRDCGINLTSIEDKVHAAMHLVNQPRSKDGEEPLSPSNKQDVKDANNNDGK